MTSPRRGGRAPSGRCRVSSRRFPRGSSGQPGHARAERRGHPAVVIDRPAAHDLEVLRLLPPGADRSVRVRGETRPGDRDLGHAVDDRAAPRCPRCRRWWARRRCSAGSDRAAPHPARPSSASGSPAGCGCRPDAMRAVSCPCRACMPAQAHPAWYWLSTIGEPEHIQAAEFVEGVDVLRGRWSECRSAPAVPRWCRPGPRPRIRCHPRCRGTACSRRSPAGPARRRSGRPGRRRVRRTRRPPPSGGAETASRLRGCSSHDAIRLVARGELAVLRDPALLLGALEDPLPVGIPAVVELARRSWSAHSFMMWCGPCRQPLAQYMKNGLSACSALWLRSQLMASSARSSDRW